MASLPRRQIKHPSWRVYKAIQDCSLEPATFGLKPIEVYIPYAKNDDLTEELKRAMSDADYVEGPYEILSCLALFMNPNERQIIEALLLNDSSVAEIRDVLGCNDNFILTYKSLFFDTSIFKNHIEKLIYVKEGTVGVDSQVKNELMVHGAEYIKARSRMPKKNLSIEAILGDVLAGGYIAFKKHVDTEDVSAQEVAQGWANVMLKLADQMRKSGNNNASLEDYLIHLDTAKAPSKSLDDLK